MPPSRAAPEAAFVEILKALTLTTRPEPKGKGTTGIALPEGHFEHCRAWFFPAATSLERLSLCLCSLGSSPQARCRCCWGLPSCCVCWGAAPSALADAQTKTTGRPTPAQRGGTGGAETGPATFLDPGGRSRAAERSGFSPWKRSFCSSG